MDEDAIDLASPASLHWAGEHRWLGWSGHGREDGMGVRTSPWLEAGRALPVHAVAVQAWIDYRTAEGD